MSWAQSINVWVAVGKAGVNTTTLPPLEAARVSLLVSEDCSQDQTFEGLQSSQCLWIEGLPLSICLPAIKISVLLFYNRIFTIKPFRRSVHVAVVVLTAWGISTFLVSKYILQHYCPFTPAF